MAMSGLGFRKVLVGNGWAVSLLLCMIELRKLFSHIVGPPILALKAFCTDCWLRVLTIETLLMSGCG